MKNKKGFTLVEVIVTLAILGAVSAIITGFIIASSNMYTIVNSDIDLQNESQVTMSQLHDYIIDTNAGIVFEPENADKDTRLCIINYNDETDIYTGHLFRFDSSEGIIYYSTAPVITPGDAVVFDPENVGEAGEQLAEKCKCEPEREYVMARNVKSFTVDLSTSLVTDVTIATVRLMFSERGKSATSGEVICIRNKVTVTHDEIGTFEALMEDTCR